MIRLLRHDDSVNREEDRAVKIRRSGITFPIKYYVFFVLGQFEHG